MKLDSLLNDVLIKLDNKERDILLKRQGFDGEKKTLVEIGKDYNITRERVRQILERSFRKIAPLIQTHSKIQQFIKETRSLLKPLGVKKESIFQQLLKIEFSFDDFDLKVYQFFSLFSNIIHYSSENKRFHSFYAFDERLAKLAEHLLNKIILYLLKHHEPLPENQFFSLIMKELRYHFNLKPDLKLMIEFLSIIKDLAKNPLGFWGLVSHKFIKPTSLKDKIYLILRSENKPLHYQEIYNKLKEIQTIEDELIPNEWRKNYNQNFVKNELNKHKIFVFVGKGTYGLEEWGLLSGSAKDLVLEFLKQKKVTTVEELWRFIFSVRDIKKNSLLIYLKELSLKNKIKIEEDYLKINE